jgi:hypothetical protein
VKCKLEIFSRRVSVFSNVVCNIGFVDEVTVDGVGIIKNE